MPRTSASKSSTKTPSRSKRTKTPTTPDVPVLELAEPTDDTPTNLLGYDASDFDLSDDELETAAEPSGDDTAPTASTSATDATKHPRQRNRDSKRTVMSRGSEKADLQYAIKRLREAVWYRLRHTLGYSIAHASKKHDGFKLDTIDNEYVRVTYAFYSTPLDKMSEQAYANAQDHLAQTVDEYDAQLSGLGFTTQHASVDGYPYVIITLADNPVSQPEA